MEYKLKKFSDTKSGKFTGKQQPHVQELLDLGKEYEDALYSVIEENKLLKEENLNSNKNVINDEIPYDKLGRMVADLYKKHTTQTKKYNKALETLDEQKDIVNKYNKIMKMK